MPKTSKVKKKTSKIKSKAKNKPKSKVVSKLKEVAKAPIKISKNYIPKDNEKDLIDVPKKVREDIKIIPVESADEVLKIALTKELKRIEWTEADKISDSKKDEKSQASIQ